MKSIKYLLILSLFTHLISSSLLASEYIAFSLNVAKEKIKATPDSKDYSKLHPEVFTIGGITAVKGLVYDKKTGDVILVGERDPERAILTLDDFVVALRARLIHGEWPLVSIDPTSETEKTQMQVVRFEGGIENTQFGHDLFDADYNLKKIGMGLLPANIPGLKTYWDLKAEIVKQEIKKSSHISSRFWFYPVLPSVSIREDVVAIKGLKVGVFTEVLSSEIDSKKIDSSTFRDLEGDAFAKAISENFEELAKIHPSFGRVKGLDEMVALTKALESMEEKPMLEWWLSEYKIKRKETRKKIKVLKRSEVVEVSVSSDVYKVSHSICGGVELKAIALRFNSGDVTALREVVLKTRTAIDALAWTFIVGEWVIPTTPGMFNMEDIVPLFTQACFLHEQKRYDDAITVYGKLIALKPDWDMPYNNRGNSYKDKGLYDEAISDFNRALEINPRDADANNNLGVVYTKQGLYDEAISQYNCALEINPRNVDAYSNRGAAYREKGQYDRAISDSTKAIKIDPRYTGAYTNRGAAYSQKGQYEHAISDLTKAIKIDPRYAGAYINRGVTYYQKGQYDRAISDLTKAIKIDPKLAEAFISRGASYLQKGQYDCAISDLTKAIHINPLNAMAYSNRGIAYTRIDQYDNAISDFNYALEINPKYADAYNNRGSVYFKKHQNDQAIADFNKAIKINPNHASAYANRGKIFYFKGDNSRACSDVRKACELGNCENYMLLKKSGICP